MSKKLQGNGMWESSRMMLPEHKERIIRHNQRLDVRTKPVLDEQKLEMIDRLLRESFEERREVTLTLFDPIRSRTVAGTIGKLDWTGGKVRIGEEWIRLADIIDCR